jgi:RNA polymerase sigma factor (sigma-70 family)
MSPMDAASAALDTLIARCASKVRLVGRTHRLDPSEVDEVFQEVRVRIWTAIGPGESIAGLPSSYVYRTATSVALDLIRRRRTKRAAMSDPIHLVSDPPDARSGSAELIELQELGGLIEESLAELPTSRRGPVRMFLDGYAKEEIAAVLGWTEPKTRNLLYRGLADLRAVLGRRGVGPEGVR